MKIVSILFLLLLTLPECWGQSRPEHFDNEYKEYSNNRTDYKSWKVFVIGNPQFINSIKQIDYTLDGTYGQQHIVVINNSDNPFFTMCNKGWGEIYIKIRISYNNGLADTFESYRVDLTSPNKRNINLICNDR
ncbi:hypothetical protein PQ469_07980 [Mucilaginibacter sp. KACC 22773]|uniref:pYEATS domain-containing protein n=1 Tax=Mucilaginibacter sp. KACC 22773 TaxID=3025671 RepID=UPI002365E10E|nr:pYEATS domain-containing protein [Mucilaginibacter sp. KACC 22773]WDF79943.1 hypothetical protein PQ469_07980 [Mucilaginibacter sp. KACC 22773]